MWHLILWDTKIWYGNKNFFASEFLILKIYPINEVKNFLHHFLNINYVELEKKNSKQTNKRSSSINPIKMCFISLMVP